MRRTTAVAVAALTLAGVLVSAPAAPQVAAHSAARPVSQPVAAAVAPRPNVLVIETDDMRTDDLRFMPRTRRLIGDRGLTFENSFAPNPLCCPSRTSFLTGRYSHNHQVLSHLEPYGFASFDDRSTLATALADVGYRTALVGKYLNGYGSQPLRRPAALAGTPSVRYVPPGWTHWAAGSEGKAVPGGTYNYFHLAQNVNGRIVSWPGRYSTNVLGAQTRAVTDRWRTGRPWFVWWTPVAPHHGGPGEPDDPRPTRRADGRYTSWDTPARPDWVEGRFDATVRHAPGVRASGSSEADLSDKPRYLQAPDPNAAERAAMTEVTRQRAESLYVLDVQVGRTLARLAATGQLARTVVVFTSDNGYYLGEHRRRQGKISAHEPSLRVPLLIAGPGVPRGKRFDPAMTVDLAPTIASYAGARLARPDGIDLRPVITEGDRGWTRPVLSEARMSDAGLLRGAWADESAAVQQSGLNTRGLRLGRWKLTRYSTGEQELYDLAADPLELQNLAGDPAAAEVLAELTALHRLYQECDEQECREPLPEPFSVGPLRNREITETQRSVTQDYFR